MFLTKILSFGERNLDTRISYSDSRNKSQARSAAPSEVRLIFPPLFFPKTHSAQRHKNNRRIERLRNEIKNAISMGIPSNQPNRSNKTLKGSTTISVTKKTKRRNALSSSGGNQLSRARIIIRICKPKRMRETVPTITKTNWYKSNLLYHIRSVGADAEGEFLLSRHTATAGNFFQIL